MKDYKVKLLIVQEVEVYVEAENEQKAREKAKELEIEPGLMDCIKEEIPNSRIEEVVSVEEDLD